MFNINSTLPSITVSEFKQYLPMLLSTDPKVDRRPWLAVCIDPRLRVIVVDDVTGEPVHEVPQLHYTPNVLTGKNIAGRLKEWQMMQDVSPLHGKAYAREHVTSEMLEAEIPQADITLWRSIMQRYGYSQPSEAVSDTVDVRLLGDGDSDDW